MTRRMLIGLSLCSASGALPCLLAAVRGDEAMYVGGTVADIPDNTKGSFDLSRESEAVFTSKKGSFSVPYSSITSLEYGQKAGRRVGVALAVNPLFLFSKKRRHFLTIGFKDSAGKPQGAVLELAKGTVRPVVTALEAKTGKQVEYESEAARQHPGN